MRRSLTALFIALLLVVGFGIGLLVGLVIHDGGVALTPGQKTSASQVAGLQERIIRALQSDYYRKVDVTRLGTKAIDGMLKSLNDPWTVYLDPKEWKLLEEQTTAQFSGIGAYLEKAKDGSLLVTGVFARSPAKKAGIGAGDRILSVDGIPTKGHAVEANVAMIKGPEGTEVRLVVRKKAGGALQRLTLTREQIAIPITARRMLTTNNGVKVGYVDLTEFATDAGDKLRSAVDWTQRHGARWIVLDLRYNPGGYVREAVAVSSLFIRSGTVVSMKGLHVPREVYPVSGKVATTLPMVLLVNRYSASASEITAGALQDHHRATLIGTRTFGKGLVQEVLPMPQKAALKLTIAVYYTPDGRNINKRGILPEVVVKDKPKQKGDEQLQAALKYIGDHAQP